LTEAYPLYFGARASSGGRDATVRFVVTFRPVVSCSPEPVGRPKCSPIVCYIIILFPSANFLPLVRRVLLLFVESVVCYRDVPVYLMFTPICHVSFIISWSACVAKQMYFHQCISIILRLGIPWLGCLWSGASNCSSHGDVSPLLFFVQFST